MVTSCPRRWRRPSRHLRSLLGCALLLAATAGVAAAQLPSTLFDTQLPATSATQHTMLQSTLGTDSTSWRDAFQVAPARSWPEAGVRRLGIAMDATITSTSYDYDDEYDDDRLLAINVPLPVLRIQYSMSQQLALDFPISFQYQKFEGNDASTALLLGVMPTYRFSSDVRRGRPYVGVGALLVRESEGGESLSRFGVQGNLGYEMPVWGDMLWRAYLFAGRNFEKDNYPAETYFGLGTGFGCDIFGAPLTPEETGRAYLRIGAAFERRSFDTDGEFNGDDNTLTTATLPAPYVGFYYGLDQNARLAIGGDLGFERYSQGDASLRYISLRPSIEYNLSPNPWVRSGVRLKAFGVIENQAYKDGSFDVSGTVTGFGAGVFYSTPIRRSVGAFGIMYQMMGENEDTFQGKANSFIFSMTFDHRIFSR